MRYMDYYLYWRDGIWVAEPYGIVVPAPVCHMTDRWERWYQHWRIAEVIAATGAEYPRRLVILSGARIIDQLEVPIATVIDVGPDTHIVEWVSHDMYVPTYDGPAWSGAWYIDGEVADLPSIPPVPTARQLRELVGSGYTYYVDWLRAGTT